MPIFREGKQLSIADFEKDRILVHYAGHEGVLQIGKQVELQWGVCLDFSGNIYIEDGVILALNTMIYTHDHQCYTANWRNLPVIYHPLVIKKLAYVGAGSIILANCGYIGESAVVAAGSVVTHPVSDFTIVAGNPAQEIGVVTK